MKLQSDDLATEHRAMLRHWAGVQARVTQQMRAQDQRCAALEAEVVQWRAHWVVATTQMAWGLGWPGAGLARPVPARRAHGDDIRDATDVLCQTGCAGHAHPWRADDGQCRLTGGDCTRVPPTARERSVGVGAVD